MNDCSRTLSMCECLEEAESPTRCVGIQIVVSRCEDVAQRRRAMQKSQYQQMRGLRHPSGFAAKCRETQ